jgi:hypothetical protein
MVAPTIPEAEFIMLFEKLGASRLSRHIGVRERQIYARREVVEKKLGRQLISPNLGTNRTRLGVKRKGRIELECRNGIILIGGDCHYCTGAPSLMHRTFVKFCKELKPYAVILNGDVLDFSQISKHAPIGWETRPLPSDEIETAKERLFEIEQASGKAIRVWPIGNHDQRFETVVATKIPELAKIAGVHLHDHFPLWEPCWSCWINNDVVAKHRFKGGINAVRNNVLNAGKHIISGHRHAAQVWPITNYSGTLYGVDTGCIADPDHVCFLDYTEDNPKDWRAAFAVLTFKEGRVLCPELVTVFDKNRVQFRGDIISISKTNASGR